MIRRDGRPLIAVVGSLDPTRTYEPVLRGDPAEARAACGELGEALARSGCDLVLFSSKPDYAEALVAAGYVAASSAEKPGRIVAKPPQRQQFTLSLPAETHVEVETVRDTSPEWEIAFYRTILQDVDGVILVGGGRSTLVTGVVTIAQRIPVLPVSVFGGGAERVWIQLDRGGDQEPDDIALLGAPWGATSATKLVDYLRRQITRRADERAAAEQAARRRARSASTGRAVAAVALIAALTAIPLADGAGNATFGSLTLLLFAPMLAAVAGAVIWDSFNTDQHWALAAVRGLGAGVVTVLLYVASQLLANPTLLDVLDVRRLLFFVIPLGFVAGLTFDLVYHKLRSAPDLPGTDLTVLTSPGSGEKAG
ncbi:hypothetical protein Ade02nite_78610 [Paractinoplanes deccanensis]|uniref:Uncharacterized protein n=1 Tax=Paractinoplanes deccanensis TaxID=113561 RepID=A0ABQ3YGS4_9ACTN|nr:hypothetical protein [Actinoplanes deccanensis]GID79220.1 hypothetical protein Ade02nite_78610 [Actinoplanes deccanensis]